MPASVVRRFMMWWFAPPASPYVSVTGVVDATAALAPVPRILHLGTIWGISAVQQEVVPVDGRPEVRPVIPILFLFDHRLVDGVLAGRLLGLIGAVLAAPAAEFGPDGRRPPQQRATGGGRSG